MKTSVKCKHENVQEISEECFMHCCALEPYTYCSPAAHGGISTLYRCLDCRQVRRVNSNGIHTEESTWGSHEI